MSAPNKLYLNAVEFSKGGILKFAYIESTIVPEMDNKIAYNREEVYIIESEHDRIVSELKKQHTYELEQARFAYELQAINYEKQIEELRQLLK